MKRIELLPSGVTYYKANLHCHTIFSDGNLTPEEVKKAYQEKGYHVVAFTDHRNYQNHSELNDDQFLAIAAFETDINDFSDYKWDFSRVKTYHINWYDKTPGEHLEEKKQLTNTKRKYHDIDYINAHVEKMRELGFLGCYNHPYWSLQTYEDYKNLKGFWAMEIYNHGCELDGMYGYNPQSYDEMLRSGQKLYCVSTDDNHNSFEFEDGLSDSFGGYVMIGASEFSYEGIMDALEKGNFYSCVAQDGREEAPQIHEMYIEDNRLHIKCSPVQRIYVQTMGRNCHRSVAAPGETIDSAVFTLNGHEGYIRLDIRDSHGRHTNSNAYFLEDLKEVGNA